MYCRKCGKRIPDDSCFCLYCGVALISIEKDVKNHSNTLDKTNFWNNNTHEYWLEIEKDYWKLIKPKNIDLEKEIDSIDNHDVLNMSSTDFYDFLFNKYFVWKYTAANRLATTRMHLKVYQENPDELYTIKKQLFLFNLNDVEAGLKIAIQIKGLGLAGGSGLLAILFPQYFGTVDQFVCKRLQDFGVLDKGFNPNSITFRASVKMINAMKEKADELNKINNTTYWTPRKIDKVLWTVGRT